MSVGGEEGGLAEALAARLCHDLAGLAGSVSGLLELSAEDPASAHDALLLARDVAAQLQARLQVMRAACCGIEPCHSGNPAGGLRRLAASLATERLRIALDSVPAADSPPLGRLLLNVILLGAEVLQGRGEIRLRGEPDGGLCAVLASARPVRWPRPTGRDPDEARHFQLAWTWRVAAACGATLRPDGHVLRIGLTA